MNWIYILVVCLAIYYIAARYLEKHIDNFDPSLVPVSSIVTLAKVAQKLVDGGGTLTSPGNLTLGTPAAPGNLIVTGTTNLVGDTKVDGSLTVNGYKGIAINGTEVTTKSPFKFFNNNNTWLSVSQDGHNYLIFRNKDNKDKDNKDKNEKLAEIDCDTTIYRGLRVTNDLTVVYGQLRGNDGSRINWYDSGPTTIDSRNAILFVTTPKQYYKSDPNWDGVVPKSTTMGGVDINGIYTYSPDNKKSARFSSENNGDITLKDSLSKIKFSVNESGMINSDGITTNSAQINGNANITGNLLMKAAAFRVKFNHAVGIRYLSQSSGVPVVNKTTKSSDNSDYWIECGARLLNLQTNLFLTVDGNNKFTLEGMNTDKRQMFKLTTGGIDAGTYRWSPPNRYIVSQLDSGTTSSEDYENVSYLAYNRDGNPESLILLTYGSGESYFIKVA